MTATNEINCPRCGSNQVTAQKKGFSGAKALAGGVLTGGIGLLAGTIGSNKIMITCLGCGHSFKPGQDAAAVQHKKDVQAENMKKPIYWVLVAVVTALILWAVMG